jgi:hypothetical protein
VRCIVYNRKSDAGVSVCQPAPQALAWLQSGGWGTVPRGFCERQIDSQIARGVRPDAAARYVRAMLLGGVTEAEAWGIIRDRDCAHLGEVIEIMDIDDMPADRWFRSAWTRSHNGGPIRIDLRKARRVQFDRIKAEVSERNRKRIELGRKPLVPAWGEIGNAIRHARDEHELRRVWA